MLGAYRGITVSPPHWARVNITGAPGIWRLETARIRRRAARAAGPERTKRACSPRALPRRRSWN